MIHITIQTLQYDKYHDIDDTICYISQYKFNNIIHTMIQMVQFDTYHDINGTI